MKRTLLSSFLLILMVSSFAFAADVELPNYSVNISDLGGVLQDEYVKKLNFISRKLEEDTGAKLMVLTVRTTRPLDTKAYMAQLSQKWGIGEKGSALLVLFSKRDKKIEVFASPGLKDIITDGYVAGVLEKYASPQFKDSNYSKGIYLVSLAISDRIIKEQSKMPKTRLEQVNLNIYSVMLAVFVIIAVFILAQLGRTLMGTVVSGIILAVAGNFIAGIPGIIAGFIIGIAISVTGYHGGLESEHK